MPGQVLTDIVLLDVDAKHFIFSGGCNVHSFEYKANEANGRIKFGNRTSTEKACERDEDHLFLDAFEKVEQLVQDTPDGFVLVDGEGKHLIRAIPK